jgi:hypothetical protein
MGMEMTTLCSEMASFSRSYSMVTSQFPSSEGDGQQLTIETQSDSKVLEMRRPAAYQTRGRQSRPLSPTAT